jgi:hypothetical protein
MISLEIKGMFIPPDQQTSSFSNKKMGACQDAKEGPCERDFVTPDPRWAIISMGGTDESGKLLPPERPNWAGAMYKSQNALEIVLGVWNSGFGIWHSYNI